jgi:hypothetical protein
MFVDLHAITKACNKPAPGLAALAMIDPADLESQPDWLLEPVISDLVFLPGKAAYAIEPDRLSARLTDNTDINNRSGDSIDYLLKCTIRGITPSIEYLRAKLMNRRIHLVITYQNEEQRFLPYVRLYASGDSGDNSSSNRYTFNGVCRLSKPAPYFEGTIEVIGSGGSTPPNSSDYMEAEVVRLPISTTAAAYTQSIPEGVLLIAVWVRSNAAQTVSIGTTGGGEELGGPQDLLANEAYNFAQALRTTEATDIFLSGLAGSNTIEFWYAQIGAGDIIKVVISVTEAEYEYIVPSGVLVSAIWVKGTEIQTVSIGTTSGGDELGGPQDLAANEGHTFAQTLRTESSTSIFLSGLAGTNQVEIWYAI